MTTRQVALVTGATSGIGQATAMALTAKGFDVVGTGRDGSQTGDHQGVTMLDLDVRSDASVAAAADYIIKRFGRLDVLVNNAGVGLSGAAEDSSIEQAQQLFDINVFGVMRVTKAVLPRMRQQGSGRIINVSSVLGFLPAPYSAVYAATKHAIEGYTESLDYEVRSHGVRAILVEPAYTKTGFESNLLRPDTPASAYSEPRHVAGEVAAAANQSGDDPAIVAQVIVSAASDRRPKLRYTAGPLASRARVLRRLAPAPIFDAQIRRLNRLPPPPR